MVSVVGSQLRFGLTSILKKEFAASGFEEVQVPKWWLSNQYWVGLWTSVLVLLVVFPVTWVLQPVPWWLMLTYLVSVSTIIGFWARAVFGREALWVASGRMIVFTQMLWIAWARSHGKQAIETLRFVPAYADDLGQPNKWSAELSRSLLFTSTLDKPHINYQDGDRYRRFGAGLTKSEGLSIVDTVRRLGGMKAEARGT